MAKRKRLSPAPTPAADPQAVEHKALFPSYPLGVAPSPAPRAPIAQVAGDAAAQAALDALTDEMGAARREGRLVQALPLEQITEGHLVRDRMVLEASEMDSLKASLRARGQQTPIEVVAAGDGRYGLISGWRRLTALRELQAETGAARFATIQALIKPLETVSDSYVAMVEENEIRASLSFYERAHLACEAVRLQIYPDTAQAVQVLFANAPSARRSKILSFTRLHDLLGAALRFPAAIPEKLGLALVAAAEADAGFAPRLRDLLRKAPPDDAATERAVLERALQRRADSAKAPAPEETGPGIRLAVHKGRVVLSGTGLTEAVIEDLRAWLAAR